MNLFDIYPSYALILMLIVEVIIILLAYNNDEYICSFIFALYMTLYPVLFIKLNWIKLEGIDKNSFIQNYEINNLILHFFIHYIIAVISFKLVNSRISGTSSRFIYLVLFIIVNSIVVELFRSLIGMIYRIEE